MKSYHLAQSVRGLLHYSERDMKQALRWVTKDGGEHFRNTSELREALMDELAKGHEVISTGPCEGFDFVTGCPGHEVKPK